jgi:hypothetical protein
LARIPRIFTDGIFQSVIIREIRVKVFPAFVSAAHFCRVLALSRGAAYPENAVKQPFINVEEKIDRFVGRRIQTPDALATATSNKAGSKTWRKAFGGVRVPRGVQRFKTHEEADAALWQMISQPTKD